MQPATARQITGLDRTCEVIFSLIKSPAQVPPHEKLPVAAFTGVRHLSPFLGERMVSAHLGNREVVVRELRPQDLKFEFEGLSQEEAILTAGILASVVGKAHGRQMKVDERNAWAQDLNALTQKGWMLPHGYGMEWLISSLHTKHPISDIAEITRFPMPTKASRDKSTVPHL